MEKLDWFNLNKNDRVAFLEEKLDKLGADPKLHEKKELEKEIFEILNWEQKYDK